MNTAQWRPVGQVDFAQLREARLQSHYAAQWLARVARAYVAPRPDDGHTNLRWDDSFGGFFTHPLPDGTRLGLRLADLTLALFLGEDANQPHDFPLDGRSDADVRAWLGGQAQAAGLPAEKLDDALPYEMPLHPLATGGAYTSASLGPSLRELAAWYTNGAASLGAIRQRLLARGLPAPEVRCWPHHFDLDCLTVIGDGAPYVAPTMGAGFSPGDHYYEEPYFYISVYPRPDLSLLPPLLPPGHWHTEDFLAAVAPASRILALDDPETETDAFLFAATDAIVAVLQAQRAPNTN
jgi:hypothetical protein